MRRQIIQVDERPPLLQSIPLSLQHLFAMFGASVLVPMLFKIDPGTVLLFNGIGTLIYLALCQGKVPAYLGSSFAFLSFNKVLYCSLRASLSSDSSFFSALAFA